MAATEGIPTGKGSKVCVREKKVREGKGRRKSGKE